MSARAWRRLVRQHRVTAYALLGATLLLVVWIFDGLWSERENLIERLDRLETLNAAARAKKEQLPKLDTTRQESAAAYAGAVGRMLPPDAAGIIASEKFGQLLKGWYENTGIAASAILSVDRKEKDGIVYYRAAVEAPMRIEQFSQLMQNKRTAPLALRLAQATVEANDPRKPTGLLTHMDWEALQAMPIPEVAKPMKTETTVRPDKSGSRVQERGKTEPTMKPSEEKRK
jgi:hypothetical protein